MEAEFWYLLFALAKRRGAKTLLINARMSDRSFPRYQKMGWLYRQIFRYIDEIYAQTQLDKERLEALGAKHVVVTGNIKLAVLPQATHNITKPEGVIVCAASTHPGEESLILDAFGVFKKEHPDAKLILVPRHPERFGKVAAQVEAFADVHTYRWHRYALRADVESDITLVDTLGELVNIYAISDIVILGGSFVPIGGHNAAEAAQFGCRIISGPHYFNQRDIYEAIDGIVVAEGSNLASKLLQYKMIMPAKRKFESDLGPILRSIEAVLPSGKEHIDVAVNTP
jgi:3-deoxy-D-manno-octulosonic-acid transferase